MFAKLQGGQKAGASQAVLRVLLALGAADRPVGSFDCMASLSDLQDLTGLSRSMVLKGIRGAVENGLIEYQPGKQGEKSRFVLVHPEGDGAGGWAKLPIDKVRACIPRIPHRGAMALTALKIYLTLIAARPKDNAVVSLRHDTLRFKTGCQPHQVRAAISLLANEGLIHVIKEAEADDGTGRYRAQQYLITGRLEAPQKWNAPSVVAQPVVGQAGNPG